MKKILFGLLTFLGIGLINFSSASNYTFNLDNFGGSDYLPIVPFYNSIDIFCSFPSDLGSIAVRVYSYSGSAGMNTTSTYVSSVQSGNYYDYSFSLNIGNRVPAQMYFVLGGNRVSVSQYTFSCQYSYDYTYGVFVGGSSCDYSDYVLESDITETYCTNKFSTLIDESDITSGYCETQFGLIDPENCPASGGTGDIQRSSFFVNNHQVEGASNIYLYLPDFLNWDYTYLNSGSTLQIDVENEGDTDYINGLLAVETYHPSSEDFTQSFTGTITLIMPYIIITLFILFIWRLIRRIFK